MANKVFSFRDSILRIYDATSGTPNYVVAKFRESGLECPIAYPLPEEQLMLNQNKADSLIHYMRVSDEKAYQPIEGSFSGLLYDTATHLLLLPALGNALGNGGTWTVGSATTFVAVTSPGTRENLDGSAVTCPLPVGTEGKNLVNLEILWDGDSADWGLQMKAVQFPGDQIKLDDSSPTKFSCQFKVFGTITKITSFTTGAEVTS